MTSNRQSEHLYPLTDEALCCATDVQPGINNMLACSLAVHGAEQPHLALGDDGSVLSRWTASDTALVADTPSAPPTLGHALSA